MDEGVYHVQHEYVPNFLRKGNKGHQAELLKKSMSIAFQSQLGLRAHLGVFLSCLFSDYRHDKDDLAIQNHSQTCRK